MCSEGGEGKIAAVKDGERAVSRRGNAETKWEGISDGRRRRRGGEEEEEGR